MIFQFNSVIAVIFIFFETNFALNCSEKTIKFCRCNEDDRTYVVDCSHIKLKSIPKNIPIRTTHLYLDDTNIKILENGSFHHGNRGLPHLVTLSIKRSKLKKIEPAAFHWLPNLKELNLYNRLEKETSLPKSVFKSLNKSLKMLDIRINLMNPNIDLVNYPKAVADLHNLEELRMDCLTNKSLPAEYSSLNHLQRLIFGGGRWNVRILHQKMFAAISKLRVTKIDLNGLYTSMIFEKTFSGLYSLNWLDLSNNPKLSLSMKNFAASLNETSVTKLNLNNTGLGTASQNASTMLRLFCNLPLKELTLDHNYIYKLDPLFKECFRTLEVVAFGDNYVLLTGGFVSDSLWGLPNLIGYNLSWQVKANGMVRTRYRQFEGKSLFIKNKYNSISCMIGMTCPILMPQRLEWIDISHHGFYLVTVPQGIILTNTSLKSGFASNCGIQTVKLPVYCPPGWNIKIHVEMVDVSNNGLQCVNATTFDKNVTNCDWRSVKYVNLRNNQLGNTDTNTCNHDRNNIVGFLRPLTDIKTLDLAMNMFKNTYRLRDLEYLTNLEILDLSHNRFQNYTINLRSFTSLAKLNLSYNNLRCLSQKTMSELTSLQKLHPWYIKIDLTGNLLSCNCECFTFFQWMSTTKVVLTKNNTYQCVFDNGTKEMLSSIESIISQLFSQCYSPRWLTIYIGTEALVLVLITVFCLVYRMRHEIRYMYLRIKLNRQKLTVLLNQKGYKYTAFVSCDHRDAKYFIIKRVLPNLETPQTNFKFCIAQRDFVVGTTIIGNIIAAMHNSRKIIFIISQYFLTSKWCKE